MRKKVQAQGKHDQPLEIRVRKSAPVQMRAMSSTFPSEVQHEEASAKLLLPVDLSELRPQLQNQIFPFIPLEDPMRQAAVLQMPRLSLRGLSELHLQAQALLEAALLHQAQLASKHKKRECLGHRISANGFNGNISINQAGTVVLVALIILWIFIWFLFGNLTLSYKVGLNITNMMELICVVPAGNATNINAACKDTAKWNARRRSHADFGVSLAATSLDNYFIRDDDWFICITCHKKYKHRTSVWRHVKWECNKQPQFECHVCGKRVTQKATLKTHVENVHGLVYGEFPVSVEKVSIYSHHQDSLTNAASVDATTCIKAP
ncbi:hypothetical protein YQE_09785, partial [Dendroctonus ponderosae]